MFLHWQLVEKQSVGLNWVWAHVGNDLNEQADQLAKEGTTSQNIFEGIAHTMCTQNMQRCGLTWTGQPSCRQSRLMILRPSTIVTDYIMSRDRADCSLLVHFLTGHNYLRYHLYVIGVVTGVSNS